MTHSIRHLISICLVGLAGAAAGSAAAQLAVLSPGAIGGRVWSDLGG